MLSTGTAGSIWLCIIALVLIVLAALALNYITHPVFRPVVALVVFSIIAIVYNNVVEWLGATNLTTPLVLVAAGAAYFLGWAGVEKDRE